MGGPRKKAAPVPNRFFELGASNHAYRFCDNSVRNSKYTILNFVPRALFEQFRRLANVYFLVMGGLMLLGTYTTVFETPLGAFTTLFPLSIVLCVSMVQEALSDVKRHRSDDETNNRKARVTSFHTGQAVQGDQVKWSEIQVGDLIWIKNKQPLPADVVVLCSSEEEHIAYIETSPIDGETNLKLRRSVALPDLAGRHMTPYEAMERCRGLRGQVECDPPNMNINAFTGTLSMDNKAIPIDNENVIYRGSLLRNTKWIVGLVVYTGEDTKLQRNARHAPSKMSRIDQLVNRAIYMIFFTDVVLVTISTLLLMHFEDQNFSKLAYVGYKLPTTPASVVNTYPSGMNWRTYQTTFIQGWLAYIVLYNNFIPISMYVTLELVTYVHIFFINEDKEMYHEESDTPAKARSNIVTDLGQIEYIFSDKTGTLTQNVMRFKRCSIGGRIYGGPVLMTDANQGVAWMNLEQLSADAKENGSKGDLFLRVLSLCNTVVVERDVGGLDISISASATAAPGAGDLAPTKQAPPVPHNGSVEYQAESPDEKALVEAAKDFGYELDGRSTALVRVKVFGDMRSWEPLAVNKFDSDRKRMSIVLRDPKDGQIWMLCKGADTSMLGRGKCDTTEEAKTLVRHLDMFAEEGLRTLVLGYRHLTEAEYEAWNAKYRQASTSATERARKMTAVADELETDMRIIGITAIEDKLQDGVPDTIADLAKAGIKVCVLTGDKMETAINIGLSCKVLRHGMTRLELRSGTADEVEFGICKLYRTVKEEKPDAPPMFPFSIMNWRRPCAKDEGDGIFHMLEKHFPSGTPTTPDSGINFEVKNVPAKAPRRTKVAVRFTKGTVVKGKLKDQVEGNNSVTFAIVMEGPALLHVLGNKTLERMLFEIMQSCVAVIACRVSPKQKADIVKLVRNNVKPEPVTLAIGDGANDVGMIQTAHVGIGVSGNEGQQAVNASDFAIAQFRFLKRLLLVHGRWDYRRISKVMLYSFYKNMVLVMTLFFYCTMCGYSGTSVYEDNVLAGYNFFLGLPILFLGLFDKDVSAEYAMAHPVMYLSGRKNLDLNNLQVLKWVCAALLHGFFVYFFVTWSLTPGGTYSETGYLAFGLALYSVLIITMNYRVLSEFKTITYPRLAKDAEGKSKGSCAQCGWTVWIWVGSILFFFFACLFYGALTYFNPRFEYTPAITWGLPQVWLQIILVPVICIAIDSTYNYLIEEFCPSPVNLGVEENRCLKVDPEVPASPCTIPKDLQIKITHDDKSGNSSSHAPSAV